MSGTNTTTIATTSRYDDPWRADLIRRCGQVMLLGTPWIIYLSIKNPRPMPLSLYGLFFLGGLLTAFATPANFRQRGSLLVLCLLLCGAGGVRFVGSSPGTMLSLALGPVVAAVVLGGRAAMLALLTSALSVSVLGSLGRVESLPRWTQALAQPEAWYRMAVTFTLLTALLVLFVRGAVRRVEASLTETRRAEAALRASEERWRRISEASFEGIAFTEAGVVVDANQQLACMFGYEIDDLVGKPIVELVAPEQRALVQAIMNAGQTTTYAHHARRKDGSIFPVETRARMLAAEGRTLRVTAIRDMSEEERLQAELEKQERLAAVGAVVAGVAHEVRTPLFSISATLDAYEPLLHVPAERREFAALLRLQIDRLRTLMRNLLDYGSPPALQLARGSVAPAIRRSLSSCARLAREAGVSLEEQLHSDGDVDRDADRLEQVFVNLIDNAIQHAPRGTAVRVATAASQDPAGVTCTVEDAGGGVSPDDLRRVFQPFFSRRRGGTGLGLAIAQRIVEEHGGALRAGNQPGGGASFTVFLPAPKSRAA